MHITISTYQRSAADGAADCGMEMALTLKVCPLGVLEFVSEPHANYPRPGDDLRGNELRARGEYALDHIRQVLGVQLRRPRILRDSERRVVLSEGRIFEPEVCR